MNSYTSILPNDEYREVPLFIETPAQTSDTALKFEDLIWYPHPSIKSAERASISYPNGYGASILRGGPFYTIGNTYELAVLDSNGNITYDTTITSDVLGYLSKEELTKVLKDIFELQPIILERL